MYPDWAWDVLIKSDPVVFDHHTGRPDNTRDGPVVRGHPDRLACRKILLKIHHDGRHRAAEPVYGLVIIADHA